MDSAIQSLNAGRSKYYSLLLKPCLASYSVGMRVPCLGVQKQGHEADHSPLSSIGVISEHGMYSDNLLLFNLTYLLAVTQILYIMHFLSLLCLIFIVTLFKTIFYAILCSCNVAFLNVKLN